ncbi:MAG TPA: hypothetical protein VG407_01815 [Caulobacteraceae bacterium]|nr:hypothetical protein [Caulobacteraceae bacterium]
MTDETNPGPAWDRKPRPKGQAPRVALVIALIVGTLWGAVTIINGSVEGAEPGHGGLAYKLGGVMGQTFASAMLIGVIMWLIVYFAAVKPSGRRVGAAYFAILITVFTLIFGPLSFLHQFGGLSGGSAQVAELAQRYNAVQADDGRQFQSELAKTTQEQVLDPESLERLGGLAKASEVLKKQRGVVTAYQALILLRQADERARINALNVDAETRTRALADFNAATSKNNADLNAYLRLQFDILDHEDALVAFLTRSRDGWRAVGAQFTFTRPGLLPEFQAIVTPLRSDQTDLKALIDRVNAPKAKTTTSE